MNPKPADPTILETSNEALKWLNEVQMNLDNIDSKLFGPRPAETSPEAYPDNLQINLNRLCQRLAGLAGQTSRIMSLL